MGVVGKLLLKEWSGKASLKSLLMLRYRHYPFAQAWEFPQIVPLTLTSCPSCPCSFCLLNLKFGPSLFSLSLPQLRSSASLTIMIRIVFQMDPSPIDTLSSFFLLPHYFLLISPNILRNFKALLLCLCSVCYFHFLFPSS